MNFIHKELAAGKWFELSLYEQMANIGSDVHRAIKWFKQKDKRFENAFYRALELFDLTLMDDRRKSCMKEIARTREVFCMLLLEHKTFSDPEKELDSLDKYFFQFGVAAQLEKKRKLG